MNSRLRLYILACDASWVAIALGLSYGLRYSQFAAPPSPIYGFLVLVGMGVWALLFTTMSLDCFDGGWRLHVAIGKVLRATFVLVILMLASAYLARVYYSRLLLIYFSVLLLCGFLLIRIGFVVYLRTRYRKGHAKRVVLVGNERFTREFAFKINRHPELLYQVVGTLYPAPGVSAESRVENSEPLSSLDVLKCFAERRVDELIVLQEEPPGLEFQTFVARCRSMGMRVNVVPRGYELYTSKPKLIEIDGLPLISLETPVRFPYAAALKRAMDVVISLLLIPPAIFIFVVAAGILAWHGRRVFRRELRIGQHGRRFWMYRLNVDRKREDGPAYERIIRELSISEIPQIWNVLAGDMSLVGPRPENPERVNRYSDWERERLKAKPGVTGLAQVNGLREHHGSEDKARFDLQYLLEWSPWNDLMLILQTLATLAGRCVSRLRRSDHATDTLQPEVSKSFTAPRAKRVQIPSTKTS